MLAVSMSCGMGSVCAGAAGAMGWAEAALACAGENMLSAQSFHHLAPASY